MKFWLVGFFFQLFVCAFKSYGNLDQFLVSPSYFQYLVFMAKDPSFSVGEVGKHELVRLKFHYTSKKK